MYRIATTTTQNREPQLPHASRNTNPHVSKSSGVNHTTSVSRPQLKCYQVKDKVVPNNSQVKFKKKEVEDHYRISSISKKTKSITACNDSSKSRTSNVNAVYAECGKCVFNSNHDACVSRYLNDIVQLILFIVDSGCTKHMTGNLKLLCNFVEKFLGTVRFRNDQFAPILGYGDLNQGNVMIKWVYYVEGLNHNLFSVGQFCDADLEVAFRKSTCFVRDLQGNDLLTGNRGSDLYTISLQETTSSTPICFMAKASPTQAWLWHRRLSHLNFDYITLLSKKDIVTGLPKLKYVKDQLCSSCEISKAKRSSFKSKVVPSSKGRLNLLHMDLCGPMRVASINGKKYILVIVDDYSRYTWTLFLRSKDETTKVSQDFLTMIQPNLQAQVISVRTDRGTKFLNKTLHAYFKEEGIEHQISTPRTPEQNGVVERWNRILVEVARMMLSAFKLPLSFWAEAVATACYTQNRSIIILTHGKTAYHIINDRKPSIKHLHIFAEKTDSSQQGLEFLFSPLLEEYYNPAHGHAEDNNNDQAPNAFQEAEFINPFCTRLKDYGFNYNKIPLYCDSQSAIAISCNPVQHSRTKHIHTRYHFIKEQVENGIIELYFVRTEYQLADMFTKALPEDRFKYLVRRIGMRCLTPAELEVLTNETA
ncbi:retrovirus-related pol polyprotein from transposon TNT 1-94 [Tanacetum coccineum]